MATAIFYSYGNIRNPMHWLSPGNLTNNDENVNKNNSHMISVCIHSSQKLKIANFLIRKLMHIHIMPRILACDFEVFGIVQGVSFRMFTERQANSLSVRGWCMNTRNDTVKGQIEAAPDAFANMRTWLKKTGSPTSRIDKTTFSEIKELDEFTFQKFSIRH